MQTAARLDFIGLPRLRRCGGSVFFVLERKLARGWIVGARLGLVRGCGLCRRGLVWRAGVVCVDEVWLGVRLDCGGEVWLGARLWFVSARLGLVRGCGLCRRGWAWHAAVDCGGESWAWRAAWIVGAGVGLGARLWIASARVGLALGCGLWGCDDGNAAL